MSEAINLSEATVFTLRGNVTIKVYSASIEVLSNLAPKLDELQKLAKSKDLNTQMDLFLSVIFDLIKDDNDVKQEDLKKYLTIEAGVKIMQKALGSFGNLVTG